MHRPRKGKGHPAQRRPQEPALSQHWLYSLGVSNLEMIPPSVPGEPTRSYSRPHRGKDVPDAWPVWLRNPVLLGPQLRTPVH